MKIGFAGAGNMAAALARGWAGSENGPEAMFFADAGSGRAAGLARQLGGTAVESLAELALQADAVVLAMKPAGLEAAAEQLGGAGDAIASVLAATPVARLRELFPDTPVVRAMPTITTEVQRGVICHAPLEPAIGGEAGARLLNLFGGVSPLVEGPGSLVGEGTAGVGGAPAHPPRVIPDNAPAGGGGG